MWTLWLVSKVLQRLSLRSQSPAHSSPASYISGMKYKYSPMRERSTGELKGGGYRAAAFYPCQFGEYVTLVLLFSHFSITNTHTISYENISPSPNVLGLVRQQDSPQREADQRRSLHSTCFTVRPPEIHRLSFTCKGSPTAQKQGHSPTEWRAAIQQKLSPSADGAPDSEQQPKTWMSPVSFSPFQTPKIQGQERKGDSGVTVQWQGCWKDGEVTRRTFTTLRGWWGHRGGTMEAQGCLFILGVIFLSHLPPLTQWQRAYWKLQEGHVLLYPGPELSFCCQFRRECDLMLDIWHRDVPPRDNTYLCSIIAEITES